MKIKNAMLTLWLAAPILVVALLCYWIFASFSGGGDDVKARAVGAGSNDTGGANALGEWLAGRDPDEVQRIKRDLREGRLVDPYQWPGGVELRVWTGEGALPPSVVFQLPGGTLDTVFAIVLSSVDPSRWGIVLMPEDFAGGHVAVVVPADGSVGEAEGGVVMRGPDGEVLEPLRLQLVPADRVPEENSQPIVYELDLTERDDSGG